MCKKIKIDEKDIFIRKNYLRTSHSIHTKDEVEKVCKELEKGYTVKQTADLLGYNYSWVKSIKDKKSWKHVSKNYKF